MTINTNEDRLLHIWQGMVYRCHDEDGCIGKIWWRYGGRGIQVCDEWRNSFDAFEKWAYENGYACYLVIDRIDNDGDYCPENCQWITREENTAKEHRKIASMWAKYHPNRKKWHRDDPNETNRMINGHLVPKWYVDRKGITRRNF